MSVGWFKPSASSFLRLLEILKLSPRVSYYAKHEFIDRLYLVNRFPKG